MCITFVNSFTGLRFVSICVWSTSKPFVPMRTFKPSNEVPVRNLQQYYHLMVRISLKSTPVIVVILNKPHHWKKNHNCEIVLQTLLHAAYSNSFRYSFMIVFSHEKVIMFCDETHRKRMNYYYIFFLIIKFQYISVHILYMSFFIFTSPQLILSTLV